MEKVSKNYKEIKSAFLANSHTLKMQFDEDVFHDTLLCCCKCYKDDTNDLKKVKAYFWVSYKTNMLKKALSNKPIDYFEDMKEFDMMDEEYVPEMDELADMVKNELELEFGEYVANLWLRHVVLDLTYEEIEKESNIHNVHYTFKKIRNFIRQELPKKNPRFKEIVRNLDKKL